MLKRERKQNFNDPEVSTLIENYATHKLTILAKFSATTTNKSKLAAWQKIATAVSACGFATRTVEDIKKKWSDLKRAAISCGAEARQPRTGGGPPPHRLWFVDSVLDVLGDATALISGIDGKKAMQWSMSIAIGIAIGIVLTTVL